MVCCLFSVLQGESVLIVCNKTGGKIKGDIKKNGQSNCICTEKEQRAMIHFFFGGGAEGLAGAEMHRRMSV